MASVTELPLTFYGRESSSGGSNRGEKAVDVVVLPGNPGNLHFYRPFADFVFEKMKKRVSVYVVGHIGHDATCQAKAPVQEDVRRSVQEQSDWTGDDLTCLDLQVLQKLSFIDTRLDSKSTLVLIGHSVGCYILLKMLPHIDRKRLGKAIFLFPTMHRIADTPNAIWQRSFYTKRIWIPMLIAKVASYLPRFCLSSIVTLYMRWWKGTPLPYKQHMVEGVMAMIEHSQTLETMLSMAECEMLQIGEFSQSSHETILDLVDRCVYYYGASDGWVLEESFRYFCGQFPEAKVHRCVHGLEHAFVLASSEEMAHMVSKWIDDLLQT